MENFWTFDAKILSNKTIHGIQTSVILLQQKKVLRSTTVGGFKVN